MAEERAQLVYALGVSNERKARPLVETCVLKGDFILRWAATHALMEIGGPESAPTLISEMEKYPDDIPDTMVTQAIVKWADASSIPLLRSLREKTEDQRTKDGIGSMIKEVETRLQGKESVP